MANKASKQKDNTINIHSYPVQMHVGSQKFVNDDWGTIAYIIDRREVQNKFADPELRYNCIYFLFGYENNMEMCYVGQAKIRNDGESVLARLREHDKSTTEKYRDIWDWAVVVTNKNGSWNLDDLNALEHAFYAEIPLEQNLNGNNPNAGGADFDKYIDKIEQIKALVTTIGFSIFAKKIQTENIQVISETNEFSIVEDLQNGMARIPEIVTPHKVVKAMVDMLPADVWNDKTVFLDPACKGGEFLREIYDRLMENEVMQSKYDNQIERSNHILSEQLYGIALSQVSLERTTKKLMGFGMNIRVIPNYIEILKTKFDKEVNEAYKREYIMNILNKEFGKTMKIDVVIGNPPYQEGNQSLYPRFIEMAMDTSSNKVLMITKNNWITGNTLSKTRNRMIRFGLKNIINYTLVREVFTGVSVAVGIFDMQKGYDGETHYTEIQNGKTINDISTMLIEDKPLIFEKNQLSIINKIISRKDFRPYDLAKNARMWSIASNGFFMHADYTEDCIDYSFNREKDDDVEVIFMNSAHELYKMFTDRSELPKGEEFVDTYKIVCGSKAASNNTVLTNINALNPGQIITNSFGIIGISKDKATAYALYQYAKTKFQRFLIKLAVSGDRVTYGVGCTCYVPLLNFANNNDIDWSQSITITATPQEIFDDIGKDLKDCKDKSIDAQLYRKYNITPEEIAYIEKTIKPME